MQQILGYGEDSLTIWALTKKLKKLLHKIGEKTSRSELVIIYRPSFGRGRWYGEFDAILASKNRIFLIESKWDESQEVKSTGISLGGSQLLRHEILEWYIKKWDNKKYKNWDTFFQKYRKVFKGKYNKEIPQPGRKLANNLEYLLKDLQSAKNIRNILLLFKKKDNKTNYRLSNKMKEKGFELVEMEYNPEAETGFFKMI